MVNLPINPITLGSMPTPEQHIRTQLIREFHLSSNIYRLLHKYYLLHWSGEYFQKQYYTKGGRIVHQDEEYILVFEEDPRKILAATKVALSFRKLYSADTHGYVLVKSLPYFPIVPLTTDTKDSK